MARRGDGAPGRVFTESQAIVRTHIGISLVATIATIALVWVFVGYVVRPIERLSATISDVERTRDLSRRVDVEFADEVGLLGAEFNRMISSLEANYSRLEAAIDAETQARELAIAREEETLLLLGRVSDFRDKETAKHLERIGTYTVCSRGCWGICRNRPISCAGRPHCMTSARLRSRTRFS